MAENANSSIWHQEGSLVPIPLGKDPLNDIEKLYENLGCSDNLVGIADEKQCSVLAKMIESGRKDLNEQSDANRARILKKMHIPPTTSLKI